ncbi:lycopene cyclase [Nakamurella antarctica]|uniref:Lycopene cyclase n=1 Tax=Nakamurella antarctica TaxID=1902245 RepID=A0A3G8ZPN6_9ACTN|nr:lycopene cyclase family protein [Nakamurella antarctica]AZI58765.1 lycopene cyclase [Nakamurella antarctica]
MVSVARSPVVVLGLGPAGRATAHRIARAGIAVVAVDPAPHRRWTPTYAAWADELPAWLPSGVRGTQTSGVRAWALRPHLIPRTYVVLDTPGLQDALTLDGVQVITGTVAAADSHQVTLTDGRQLFADVVLDARGTRPQPTLAQQTAVGVVVTAQQAAPIGGSVFMDWRRDNGTRAEDHPSFLYAFPLDEDRVLLEETCLVGRPALGLRELRQRLEHRLATRGVVLTGNEPIERVRFCVEPGTSSNPESGPVRIGSRGGLMHPATGYSVAVSLNMADTIAGAVTHGRCVQEALWPLGARQTHRLRGLGLTTLLRLPASGIEEFFAAYFALPVSLQRAYITDRARPMLTATAMAAMAARLPPRLTRIAVTSALGRKPRVAH